MEAGSNKDTIRFILDGELKHIRFIEEDLRADTSLLHYLRSIGHTGVKEGCGEGDCGACTVVIASLIGSKLQYLAVNACLIFLPMVHGCQVITVHNLAVFNDGKTILHPVQQVMIDHHGSQCGYCTPGVVMSMFAMWKNHLHFNPEMVKMALSGNLCRCTGYQPIIDAMMSLSGAGRDDHFNASEHETIEMLQAIKNIPDTLVLNTAGMRYLKPASLAEALVLKKEYRDALIISGATDIGVAVNKGKHKIETCLDISSVDDLNFIRKEKTNIVFGPCTSISEIGNEIEEEFPALHHMITLFGSLQIRNMASPGGNIAGASPIGDLLPVLMAYETELEISKTNSARTCLLEDFIIDYHKTDIRDDEIITAIRVPLPEDGIILRSYKVSKRKDVDISTVSAAFRLQTDPDGIITDARLFYGGMAAKTVRASEAEALLLGNKWTEDIALRASRNIGKEFSPISDARSSAAGRKIMSEKMLIKFWKDTRHLSS